MIALCFPLALLGTLEDLPAPAPAPVYVLCDKQDPDDVFAFDWRGVDTGGQPVEVDRTVYRFRREGTDDRIVVAIPGQVAAGTTEHRLADVLATIEPGRYSAAVQLRSVGGLWGAFSGNLLIEVVDGTPPATGRAPMAPEGLRKLERGAP